MIIKSLTRKTTNYSQLLKYMLKDEKVQTDLLITRNLEGKNITAWNKEFLENERNRIHKRENNVKMYHETMSFSNKEKDIPVYVLRDLTNTYIEKRNPNALAVAILHRDTKHTHIHFCFSGTEISGKALRISQKDFALFKKEMQEYQKEKYPELGKSIVEHGKKDRKQRKNKEVELKKRTQKKTEKERILELVKDSYSNSLSKADFMHRLGEQGLKTYMRNGSLQGIESDRKYRFASLGYDEKKLGELNYRDENLKGIQVFRDEVEKEREEREVEVEEEDGVELGRGENEEINEDELIIDNENNI